MLLGKIKGGAGNCAPLLLPSMPKTLLGIKVQGRRSNVFSNSREALVKLLALLFGISRLYLGSQGQDLFVQILE
jgi:hypothetical protein